MYSSTTARATDPRAIAIRIGTRSSKSPGSQNAKNTPRKATTAARTRMGRSLQEED